MVLLGTSESIPSNQGSFQIDELMRDSILWGCPKKKPTIERRLLKRFGVARYPNTCDVIRKRNDLVICERCGDHHESFSICRTCYLKVREETEAIKKSIKEQIDPLLPKTKEIHLQFQGEESDQTSSSGTERENLCIIEMDHPRPKWFSKNLTAKSINHLSKQSNVTLNPENTVTAK